MDLPVFGLHTVLFPRQRMDLRVFEARYLAMMEAILPHDPFVIVSIREGQEVGGDYRASRVGVTVRVDAHEPLPDDMQLIRVDGHRPSRADRADLRYPVPHVVGGAVPRRGRGRHGRRRGRARRGDRVPGRGR